MYKIEHFHRFKEKNVIEGVRLEFLDQNESFFLWIYYSELMNNFHSETQYTKVDPIIAKLYIESKIDLINKNSCNNSKELFNIIFNQLDQLNNYNLKVLEYQNKNDLFSISNLKLIKNNIKYLEDINNIIDTYYFDLKFSKNILLKFLNFLLEDVTQNEIYYD